MGEPSGINVDSEMSIPANGSNKLDPWKNAVALFFLVAA